MINGDLSGGRSAVVGVDFESAVAGFLELARGLQATPTLTGELVMGRLTSWYGSTRITGADLDRDNDMLLFQWGVDTPMALDEPTDLRYLADDAVRYGSERLKSLDFTRQVFAQGDDPEVEFDDLAMQMSVTLFYGAETGEEPNSNLWIDRPTDVDRRLEEFVAVPFVRSLIAVPSTRATAFVTYCG